MEEMQAMVSLSNASWVMERRLTAESHRSDTTRDKSSASTSSTKC